MINNKVKIFLQWLALVLLVGVLAYAVWGITQDAAFLSHAGFHPTHRQRFFGPANDLNRPTPAQVQSWMTFRYINLVFRLEPDFFKSQLGITDAHYPNISINTLANEQKKSAASELLLVQQTLTAATFNQTPKAP
jgi:hypothetical protein